MKVTVPMEPENKFLSEAWWTTDPQFFVETLANQLTAATAIWPELRGFAVAKITQPPKPLLPGDGAENG